MSRQTAVLTGLVIHCPTCHNDIGKLVQVNGRLYLFNGSILAREFIHYCPIDGRQFYWHGKEEDRRLTVSPDERARVAAPPPERP